MPRDAAKDGGRPDSNDDRVLEIQAQMHRLTETVQQLVLAQSTGEGQRGGESGGSANRVANNSSGAGRVSLEEATAGTGQGIAGATTATGGAGQDLDDSSSVCTGAARPPDSSRRRPEVSAGVGPTTSMERRGETTDLRPTGTAAVYIYYSSIGRDGRNQFTRVVPPILKGRKYGFPVFLSTNFCFKTTTSTSLTISRARGCGRFP